MKNKIQKGFMASLLGTVIVMSSGLAVQAEMPEDFWEFDLAYDEDDNTIYEFSELEVVIPENWEDRYDVEEADDGLRFYSTAVREYCQRENPASLGGELFTLHASQDYGFLEEPQYSYIIGSSDDYIYYLTVMQGEAYEPEDAESADDWRDLSDDREWIEEQAFVTQPGEGIVDTDQMEESAQEHADNSEVFVGEYIVPESSDRELTAEDLEGLDANELQMAINEIYARHHRKFLTKSIQEYFESKSWYTGKVEAAKFDESSLSLIEGKNIALMQQCMSSTSGSGIVGNAADTGADMSGTVANAAGTGTGISGTVENGMTLYATATVNIRSKATTDSAIMGIVPQGYAVSATGSAQNGWIPVNYNGVKGYIRQDLLKSAAAGMTNSGGQVDTDTPTMTQMIHIAGNVLSCNGTILEVEAEDGSIVEVWYDQQKLDNIGKGDYVQKLKQGSQVAVVYDENTMEIEMITLYDSESESASQEDDYASLLSSGGTICGTVVSKDLSSGVEIQADDGNVYYFLFGKWSTYSFGEVGDYVEVQYLGSLDGEPQVQSVTKKATEEDLASTVQSVEGTVTFEGNDIIDIQTADGASYSFLVGSTADSEGCTTGDVVVISYRGTLDTPEVISVVKK